MFDYHIHTIASDGELTPTQIVDMSIKLDLEAIAITDHDTTDGIEEAMKVATDKNYTVIPGIELNAKVDKGQMHILGYYIDYKNSGFINIMTDLKNQRDERNERLIKAFNADGVNITIEDVKKHVVGQVVAKPHFAKELLAKGFVSTFNEAYDKYFNKPPYNTIKREAVTPEIAIGIVKKFNGIAVLAHPQTLKLESSELEQKIKELKSYGLDGIECYHSDHSPTEVEIYKSIAKKYNLIITCGSDYHGPNVTSNISLGSGINGNIINSDVKMMERR
jgi:predicted metal-dependent phosphoesterase TrpH